MAKPKAQKEITVQEFVALPKAERRALYPSLSRELRSKVRHALEKRRGFVRIDGRIELTSEVLREQRARLESKAQELTERKAILTKKIVEIDRELAARGE